MRGEKDGSGQLDRRRLLKAAGLAVGAAGTTSAVAGNAIGTKEEDNQSTRYRETESVKTYYRLARF